ncbi:DMT family transporter [Furfurilactobacillus curtus]|uniref:QacE family quaternary ammonium compound efflux SMR transporter n=1 Tax=Furfurilactobacillus curtus TaxID=1746200 RepID=A0ABQ5JM03_9LACO
MSWIYLVFAGLFEVVWASAMKLSAGFTQIFWTGTTVVGMILSFVMLSLSLKDLPLSVAYPIWTGIGAVGSIIVGALIFQDKFSPLTWLFVGLLVVGLIGIKLTTSH